MKASKKTKISKPMPGRTKINTSATSLTQRRTKLATTTEYGGRFGSAANLTYVVTNTLNPYPDVMFVFHGLMGFVFDRSRNCEVGINNTTVTPGHEHPHEFKIRIWVKGLQCPARPLHVYPLLPNVPIRSVSIRTIRPWTSGVYVYQAGGTPPTDPRDWRWVVDFERPPFHPGGVRIRPSTIKPKLTFDNGTFYTLLKTSSEFRAFPIDSAGTPIGTPVEIGGVAEFIGANIYLQSGGAVELTIDPYPPIPLPKVAGLTYQVDIDNNCNQVGQRCTFYPGSDDPKARNDFYLNYQTFDVGGGGPEVSIKRSQRIPRIGPLPFCAEETTGKYGQANNEAPCGGSGYGQGNGSKRKTLGRDVRKK